MTALPAIREIIVFANGEYVRLPLAGDDPRVQFSDLVRFQPKMLFGEPSKDDNDLLSSWQFGDQSGGSGVLDGHEGTDASKYSISTMYTRFPSQVTKPPLALTNDFGAHEGTGDKFVLGEMWSDTNLEFYLIYTAGLNIRRGLIDTGVLTGGVGVTESSGNLTTLPYNEGVSFQGTHTEERFFIPQGNSGYATITDTSTSPTEFTAPKFAAFANWDNKLVGITTGGRLYKTVDGVTWIAYDLTFALSKSYSYRGIVNYFDRSDEPCLYILTGRDIWQFDPAGPEVFRLDFGWPSHPDHARAWAVWNSQLYIAVGMGVFRYTGGAWMAVGLDINDGLPAEYQGRIVSLKAGYNALYAMVQANVDDVDYGSKSSIHEFTGASWHMIWNQDTAVPTSDQYHGALNQTAFDMNGMAVTQSGGEYTLCWGTGGSDDHLYTMSLSVSFANPRAGIRAGTAVGSGLYYFHETSEFDADMEAYTKIGNAIQVRIEEPVTTGVTDAQRDTLRVLARFDRGEWELVGTTLAKAGRYSFPLGDIETIDNPAPGRPSNNIYLGRSFEIAQFRRELLRASSYHADKPPLITNTVFSFLKTVESNYAWQVTVDCSQGNDTMGPQELMDWIDQLVSFKQFVVMTLGPYSYRAYISQNGGDMYSGDAAKGIRPLSILEIPTTL